MIASEHRLLLASRGDPLTPFLAQALDARYHLAGQIDPELSTGQRNLVAAGTMRVTRSHWAERFYKSGLGYRFRSHNADRQYVRLSEKLGVRLPVLQVHMLFEVPSAPSLLYVDCTHRQSADLWPAWNPLHGRAQRRWYSAESRAYQRAEHVFAFSEWTRGSLVEDYQVDPERISVVGIGGNFGRILRMPRAAEQPPTVLMVGNDFVRKGGPVLLQAFAIVRRALPDARLVLVGTRPPRGAAMPHGVTVLGRIHDRSVLAQLYADADVVAVPSIFDPMPLVVLEAMGHGLPVVASATCGIPDMVQDGVTGHLVTSGSPADLARALLQVLTAPDRGVGLGRAGQDRLEQSFLWEHVVRRMAPTLDPLLGLDEAQDLAPAS